MHARWAHIKQRPPSIQESRMSLAIATRCSPYDKLSIKYQSHFLFIFAAPIHSIITGISMELARNSNTPVLESYALNSGVYRLVMTVIVNVAISDTLKEIATNLRSDRFLTQMIIFPIVRFIILISKNKPFLLFVNT